VETSHKSASGTLLEESYRAMAVRTTNGGRRWASVALGSVSADLTGVACLSVTDCIAVGGTQVVTDGVQYAVGAVVVRLSGGVGAAVSELPSGSRALDAVTCLDSSTCFAAGGADKLRALDLLPEMLVTRDGGTKWESAALPIASGMLQAVSCGAPTDCVAVGVDAYVAGVKGGGYSTSRPIGLRSSDEGRSWEVVSLPAGGTSGGAVTVGCRSGGHCVAAGDQFDWCQCGTGTPGHYAMTWASDDGGATWSRHVLPTIGGFDVWYVSSVSCWTTACMVAATGSRPQPGSDYYALLLPLSVSGTQGGPLSSSADGLQPQYVFGLSCRSRIDCVAVGENWSSPPMATVETRSAAGWATTFTASQRQGSQ